MPKRSRIWMSSLKLKKFAPYFFLTVIVLLGFLARLHKLDYYPLWSDEAELVVGVEQIKADGYLNGYYKGEPIFENFLEIKTPESEDKYAYYDKNYYGLKYEANKGWLPYYLLAGWTKIFGMTVFNARLLFVLISLATIIFIYRLVRLLPVSGVLPYIAAAFYAFNPVFIIVDSMARYYGLAILLVVVCCFYFLKILQSDKITHHLFLDLFLVLLFYTNIVSFLATALSLGAYWLFIKKYKINRQILFDLTIIMLATVPWLILVKFWLVISRHSSAESRVAWLIFCLGILLVMYFLNYYFRLIGIKVKKVSFSRLSFLEYFAISFSFLVFLLVPQESMHFRQLLPAYALLTILLSWYAYKFFNQKSLYYLFACLIILAIFFHFSSFNYNAFFIKPIWIRDAVKYLQEKNISPKTEIFINQQPAAVGVQLPQRVILVHSIKETYLENYHGQFYFILAVNNPGKDFCPFMNWKNCLPPFNFVYSDLLHLCSNEKISPVVTVYQCNF